MVLSTLAPCEFLHQSLLTAQCSSVNKQANKQEFKSTIQCERELKKMGHEKIIVSSLNRVIGLCFFFACFVRECPGIQKHHYSDILNNSILRLFLKLIFLYWHSKEEVSIWNLHTFLIWINNSFLLFHKSLYPC